MRALTGAWVAAWLLAGCVHAPPIVQSSVSWQEQRVQLLAHDQYSFSGRLAVANGNEGFSGGLDWRQRQALATAQLRGPLGMAALQLQYDGHSLRIDAGDGVETQGAAADAVLREQLGFDPPLSSLAYWFRGCDDPAAEASSTFDAQQRLATLTQAGWNVSFTSYQRVGALWLPQRMTLQRANLRMKLLIQHWELRG